MIKTALDHFLGKNGNKRVNCAQAIASASREKYQVADEDIIRFKKFGGGKAPQDWCGAIYAAKYVLDNNQENTDSQTAEMLLDQFEEKAGSLKCNEIRKGKKLSCSGCVETAADLLETL